MEMKFLKKEKNEVEVQFDDLTIAEILRVYLNKDSEVSFVAWKRGHITENPILKIKTKSKNVSSVVEEAVSVILSDLDSVLDDFKKM